MPMDWSVVICGEWSHSSGFHPVLFPLPMATRRPQGGRKVLCWPPGPTTRQRARRAVSRQEWAPRPAQAASRGAEAPPRQPRRICAK